jgi:pseudouridine-5'-phosphate glycosidase
MRPPIDIRPEVREAIDAGRPVVALESTIIAHGMPWPRNVETALSVEGIVRENGAVPATVAVIDGVCKVGLDDEGIERLGRSNDVWKTSLRDLPFVIATKKTGATTVAATMRIASMAGVRVFVTGGIGGVHRGATHTMDISADLTEMSKTSMAVVSAGIKSILDIGLTLEYLETLGIPVVTIGQDEFPSFYSSKSGFASPLRMDELGQVASMMQAKWTLEIEGAILVANPLPGEFEVPFERMEGYIRDALESAERNLVKGKETTPFLLRHIAEHTHGESLESNIALVRHNAITGAQLAALYAGVSKR